MASTGELSASEKKTIEFGLATAIIASYPSLKTTHGEFTPATNGERASKQLRLWQEACLGSLAQTQAGERCRSFQKCTPQRKQISFTTSQGCSIYSPGVPTTSNQQVPNAAQVEGEARGSGKEYLPTERHKLCHSSSGYSDIVYEVPLRRLMASDAAADLRPLEAIATSGCRSESARTLQKQAIANLWSGECSSETISMFTKEMLEQVVLRGQGGAAACLKRTQQKATTYKKYLNIVHHPLLLEGQFRRSVLDLLVSIVNGTESVAKEVQICSNASDDTDGEGASLSRRIEMALAVSQAFDETLIKLARGLRLTTTHGVRPRIGARRRHAMPFLFTPMAMARASGAGLYLDAYESVLVGHGSIGVPVSNRSRSQVLAAGKEPAHQIAADSSRGRDPDDIYSFDEYRHPRSPTSVSTSTSVLRERLGVVGSVGSPSPEFFGSARSNQGPGSIPSLAMSPVVPATSVTTERRAAARRLNQGLETRIRGGRTLSFSDTEEVTLNEQQRQPRLPSKTRKILSQRSSSNVSIESEPVDIPCSNEPEQDTALEEEGWSSLWDNYTRLFPGTHVGCSPPRPESRRPPESPLYFTPKNHSNATSAMITPPTSRPYHSSSSFKRRGEDSTSNGDKSGESGLSGGDRYWGRLSQMSLEERGDPKLRRAPRPVVAATTNALSNGDAGDRNDVTSEEETSGDSMEDSDCTAGLIFDLEL